MVSSLIICPVLWGVPTQCLPSSPPRQGQSKFPLRKGSGLQELRGICCLLCPLLLWGGGPTFSTAARPCLLGPEGQQLQDILALAAPLAQGGNSACTRLSCLKNNTNDVLLCLISHVLNGARDEMGGCESVCGGGSGWAWGCRDHPAGRRCVNEPGAARRPAPFCQDGPDKGGQASM